jgi:glycosyltransferase involved in cell wall biosynthesis
MYDAAMFSASVVICTHNPRPSYLRRVLEALLNQSLPADQWELLIVDNASDTPVASAWDISWHPHSRHIVETELGVAVARRRGMREASADLIVFVDDDNVLDRNYLSEAVQIRKAWPQLGAWGSGAMVPEFEVRPREDVAKLVPYLAVRDSTTPRWSNVLPCVPATPWGAGMCVRANVAAAYCRLCERSDIQIASRRGKYVLMSGEDLEICYVACEQGGGVGVFPQLRLTHLIPKERVSTQHLLRTFEGTRTSIFLVAYKWRGTMPPDHCLWSRLPSLLKNLLLQWGVDRQIYTADLRAAATARRIIADSAANAKLAHSKRQTSSSKETLES